MGVGTNGNLIPPVKGEVRNPNGKPKGTKHFATWIRKIGTDPKFETYIQHPTQGYVPFKGAPIEAVVTVAWQKAAAGDKDAREWLAKYSDGSKIDVTTDGESLNTGKELTEEEMRERLRELTSEA